jgi:hypothetical protein
MTNEQKAKRLEQIASCPLCMESTDSPLLRESAALWRERGNAHGWDVQYNTRRLSYDLDVSQGADRWHWTATSRMTREIDEHGTAPTLDGAKQAAIAWVDAQEAR